MRIESYLPPVSSTQRIAAIGPALTRPVSTGPDIALPRQNVGIPELRPDHSKSQAALADELKSTQAAFDDHAIDLEFKRDPNTKVMVMKLVDRQTGKAVRQLPSEASLRLSAALAKLQSKLVDAEY
jgi:uncharacterized FlaG/YvyC family protein